MSELRTNFSEQGLADLKTRMDDYVSRGEIPGAVCLLWRNGETQVITSGTMGLEDTRPMARETLFRITSMTKPLTALATLILIQDGMLDLNDPITRWIPEFKNLEVLKDIRGPVTDTVPLKRPITVFDLLTFQWGSGMIMGTADEYPILKETEALSIVGFGPPKPSTLTPDEWIARLATVPLMHQPGERWMYHLGSYVLSVLIARVSKKSLPDFMRDRVFAPLGMNDTSFTVSKEQLSRLPDWYRRNLDSKKLELFDQSKTTPYARSPLFPDGGAGLVTTVDDYLKFARMLINFDENLISKHLIETMVTDQMTPEQKKYSGFWPGHFDKIGFGFGVSIVTTQDGTAPIGQYGWDGGGGTSWRNDPSHHFVGIVMTQRMFDSPKMPVFISGFWKSAYAAL